LFSSVLIFKRNQEGAQGLRPISSQEVGAQGLRPISGQEEERKTKKKELF
jgi:hypothetical protein